MRIIFDTRWLDSIAHLDDPMRLTMLDAIFAYLEGKAPLLSKEAEIIFGMLKPYLDEDMDKRKKMAERSRENGKKGGRKPKKNLEEPKKPTGFLSYLEMDKYKGRSTNLLKLDAWKKEYTPYVYNHIPPLTQREFECLCRKYSSEQICDTLLQIENRKDLRKRYVSLYRTLLNWLKNNYGNAR